jgi:superfamily II RNA helicase
LNLRPFVPVLKKNEIVSQVLVATATVAWGVNFPAHLVIVKGTEFYDGKQKRYVDMPITDVLQMIGRAGPTFLKSLSNPTPPRKNRSPEKNIQQNYIKNINNVTPWGQSSPLVPKFTPGVELTLPICRQVVPSSTITASRLSSFRT